MFQTFGGSPGSSLRAVGIAPSRATSFATFRDVDEDAGTQGINMLLAEASFVCRGSEACRRQILQGPSARGAIGEIEVACGVIVVDLVGSVSAG